MARALAAAIVASLLAVSGAGGAGAQTPKRGGTVVIPMSTNLGFSPPCLNPYVPACRMPGAELVFASAYDRNPDSTLRPGLARVEFTTKPPFTLTYRIRPEARWSDGVPITARDFIYTHEMTRALFPDSDHATRIRSVAQIDRKTLRAVLRGKFAGWRYLFSFVLPRHALAGVDLTKVWTDRIDNPKTGEPIGSGPFLVSSYERGRQITFVRNKRYWGPHPAYLDRLVSRVVPYSTVDEAIAAFRRGEFDAWLSLPPQHVREIRREEPRLKVVWNYGTSWEYLAIRRGDGGHPALRRKHVRRALAYGIDRVEIQRDWGAAIDPAFQPSDSAVFLNQSPYYRPNWSTYRYRPAAVGRLLRQAGCNRGADGIYSCDGQRLSLRFVADAGNLRRAAWFELIQADLRRVGVELTPVFATPGAVRQILKDGTYDLALTNEFYTPDSLGLTDYFSCEARFNVTGYCQRLVTRDLDQADRILDSDQRARVLNRADRQMAKDVPVIPLWTGPRTAAHKTTLRGLVLTTVGGTLHLGAENWWLER